MKKLIILFTVQVFAFLFFPINSLLAQNAIVGADFSTGWGGATCPTGNTNFEYLGASASTTYIRVDTANSTGTKFFRFGVDWSGTTGQFNISPGKDSAISIGKKYSLNMTCTTSGAMSINVGSTSYKYIFKTLNTGTAPTGTFVVLEVRDTIRTFSNHTPPAYVPPGDSQKVTVTMSGIFNTGQAAYLRYSKDAWVTSTVLPMVYAGSGNNYYAYIPASANVSGTPVSYYFFSSGSGLTIAGADADLYTINLLNNTGSNYSYTTTTWTTVADGNWNSPGSWTAGVIPVSNQPVSINHNVSLNQNAAVSSIIVSSGKTLTINSGDTLQSSGTITNTGAIIVSGTMQINAGASIATNSPSYQSGSTLIYNSGGGSGAKYNQALEWPSTNPPANVTILNNTWLQLNGDRSLSGNLTVTNGSLQGAGALRTLRMNGTAQTITISNSTGGAIFGTDNGANNDLKLQIDSSSNTTLAGDASTLFDDEKKFFQINVDGVLALSRGILCKYGTFTVAGTIQINSNGYIQAKNGVPASYNATGSSLIYSNGGPYNSTGLEWPSVNPPYSVALQSFGTNVKLNGPKSISGTLTLTAGNISLDTNNLTVLGTISSGPGSYIITDSTGFLIQNVLTTAPKSFPVGTAATYNPVILDNSGAGAVPQHFNVRVTGIISPSLISANSALNKCWMMQSATSSGVALKTTFQWTSGTDEGSGISAGNRSTMVIGVQGGGAIPGNNPGEYDLLSPVTISNLSGNTYSIVNNNYLSSSSNFDLSNARSFVIGISASLPVELASFNSNINGRNIQLNWEMKSEKNSYAFIVEKAVIPNNGLRESDIILWEKIGMVKAAGFSTASKSYSIMDKNVNSGKYDYRLKMVDNDGTYQYSKVVETEIALPKNFELNQNYPNPFNPITRINYQLPNDAKVTLEIFNITGEKVAQLVNEGQSAGYYSVDFGKNRTLSSGIYYYRINAVDVATGNIYSSVKKMMLIK